MKAIGLNNYGGPEVLEVVELETPSPKAGEVRIKVSAAGINPVDVMVRDGLLAAFFADEPFPFVPGMDASGVIDSLGEGISAESGLSLGQEVVTVVDNHGGYGAYSEYICVPASSVIAKPANTTPESAASFLMNALTAQNALDTLNLPMGSTVLVTGAAGAVGTYALVLAVNEGLNVATLASESDSEFLRSLGAASVFTREDDALEQIRAAYPQGVDAVIDAAGLGQAIVPAIADGGMLIQLRPTDDNFDPRITATFVNVRERAQDQSVIARLGEQVASGLLPVRVAAIFPATEAVAAHQFFDEGGHRGRVILDMTALG
ncbi:quinone oxidoreductase family protein [Pokkaliibacter sp. CJK22405]|uniref:quinone oxidoreductase family protein n=1 Tax=Pokkaliibacter sp. CJK22405 TaxID=3384615 RepID=UPI0039853A24